MLSFHFYNDKFPLHDLWRMGISKLISFHILSARILFQFELQIQFSGQSNFKCYTNEMMEIQCVFLLVLLYWTEDKEKFRSVWKKRLWNDDSSLETSKFGLYGLALGSETSYGFCGQIFSCYNSVMLILVSIAIGNFNNLKQQVAVVKYDTT